MWRIRNELDFLVVKHALSGVRAAIIAQVATLLLMLLYFYPYVSAFHLAAWVVIHLFNYIFRWGLNDFYQKISDTPQNYPLATSILRFYTISLAITSILWGSSILFLEQIPQIYHFILYIIVIGLTFGSILSIGPIMSMFLAYSIPMNIAVLTKVLAYQTKEYYIVAVIMAVTFLYSLKSSKTFMDIFTLLIEEKLHVENHLKRIKIKDYNKEQYLKAIDDIGIGIVIINNMGTIIETNNTMREWFGNIEGLNYTNFIQTHAKDAKTKEQKELVTKNDRSYEIVSSTISDIDNNRYTFKVFKDATKEKRQKELLSHERTRFQAMSESDLLTGLHNRKTFTQKLASALYEADRTFSKVAILFIDIDNFKQINDTYGHSAGDFVLKIISKRLQRQLRQSDLLCRFAGDEFIAALRHMQDESIAKQISQKIIEDLCAPILLQNANTNHTIHITVSIGISIYPDDGAEANELLKKADQAMYAVKSNAKNGYKFYKEVS